MSQISLWPEEITQEAGVIGPAAILREQAVQLGKQTKNLVKGVVSDRRDSGRNSGGFIDDLMIVGPIIDYSYWLISVSYPIDFYLCSIRADLPDFVEVTVETEEQFISALGRVLSHPRTIKIIQAIITRSKQEQPDDDLDDSFADESNE